MITMDIISMDEMASIMASEIQEDPISFKRNKYIDSLTDEECAMFENMLQTKIPYLIITHHDTDTSEDLSLQLKKVREIYESGKQPYFIDFSKPKVLVKDNK